MAMSAETRAKISQSLKGRKITWRSGPLPKSLRERIQARSMPVPWTGCWLWLGALDRDGYGSISAGRYTTFRAHRAAYEAFRGPIADGLHIDHTCRVRCCVNPDHLEVVTPRENVLRGEGFAARLAKRTHCARGHVLKVFAEIGNPTNTVRMCQNCHAESNRRHVRKARKVT